MGRPKGSKNKPKVPVVVDGAPVVATVATPAVAPVTVTANSVPVATQAIVATGNPDKPLKVVADLPLPSVEEVQKPKITQPTIEPEEEVEEKSTFDPSTHPIFQAATYLGKNVSPQKHAYFMREANRRNLGLTQMICLYLLKDFEITDKDLNKYATN